MVDLMLEKCSVLGIDRQLGNLLGIQACMQISDYLTPETFYTKLSGYCDKAKNSGWLNPLTVMVFPEYIGTWLVLLGESKAIYTARTLRGAMVNLVLAHPISFTRQFLAACEKGRVEASLFHMKAARMAYHYMQTFARLARQYQVTIVAGSILLPNAQVVNGEISIGAGKGPLYNTAAVFRPDGSLHPQLVRKCYTTEDEQAFTCNGQVDEIPAFETPAGRLGVLVCADAWFPLTYDRLRQLGVTLLAVPSFINHSGAWDQPWMGYSGWPEAEDVDRSDIQSLSEGQAWHKYALTGRLPSSGAGAGVNVFLQLQLWDLTSDGFSLMIKDGKVIEADTHRAALINLWL